VHVLVLEAQWRKQQLLLDSGGDIGVHARAVSFSYGNVPHGSGVWIASLFAAWHMVFLLLRIQVAQGYYGTWESEDE